jgi:3-hydroxyacyl-CoA dehydrogenase/3a,7a,12a-trihydroxy-5b-cholest-24-enoyl-CoA hydratase
VLLVREELHFLFLAISVGDILIFILVNDLGGDIKGEGKSGTAADKVFLFFVSPIPSSQVFMSCFSLS